MHVFHSECITRYIQDYNKTTCPLCLQEQDFDKNMEILVVDEEEDRKKESNDNHESDNSTDSSWSPGETL